jgi:hypothetical protein
LLFWVRVDVLRSLPVSLKGGVVISPISAESEEPAEAIRISFEF